MLIQKRRTMINYQRRTSIIDNIRFRRWKVMCRIFADQVWNICTISIVICCIPIEKKFYWKNGPSDVVKKNLSLCHLPYNLNSSVWQLHFICSLNGTIFLFVLMMRKIIARIHVTDRIGERIWFWCAEILKSSFLFSIFFIPSNI